MLVDDEELNVIMYSSILLQDRIESEKDRFVE